MTALTVPRNTISKGEVIVRKWPVAASTKCIAGGTAMLASTGGVKPAVAAPSNKNCIGIFGETVDNSSGSLGDKEVTVLEGSFQLSGTGFQASDVGGFAYSSDDQTCSNTQGTNEPRTGIVSRYESATLVWVRMSLEIARL